MSTTWHSFYPHMSFCVFFSLLEFYLHILGDCSISGEKKNEKWKYLKLQRNCLRAWTRIKCVNSCNMTISDKTCWLKSWCPPIKTPICFLDKRPSRNKNSATWKYTGINHIPCSILITLLDHPKSKQLWEPKYLNTQYMSDSLFSTWSKWNMYIKSTFLA